MGIKEKLAEKSGMPREIVLNYPKLTLIGNNELEIENYKGIIEYSDTLIRLNTYLFMFRIEGSELEISSVTTDFISVRGKIKGIEML
ncbi:MAG: sporulation protein YqfC [Clostridia bacterium]|nr:sporulation protein YqfC [Clostridia bacterium]